MRPEFRLRQITPALQSESNCMHSCLCGWSRADFEVPICRPSAAPARQNRLWAMADGEPTRHRTTPDPGAVYRLADEGHPWCRRHGQPIDMPAEDSNVTTNTTADYLPVYESIVREHGDLVREAREAAEHMKRQIEQAPNWHEAPGNLPRRAR